MTELLKTIKVFACPKSLTEALRESCLLSPGSSVLDGPSHWCAQISCDNAVKTTRAVVIVVGPDIATDSLVNTSHRARLITDAANSYVRAFGDGAAFAASADFVADAIEALGEIVSLNMAAEMEDRPSLPPEMINRVKGLLDFVQAAKEVRV